MSLLHDKESTYVVMSAELFKFKYCVFLLSIIWKSNGCFSV